jgi:formylglycine-generating enzyme required for sulfatase activity
MKDCFDLKNSIKIKKNKYYIGLNDHNIEYLTKNNKKSNIKKSYLDNSFPKHSIELDEINISKSLVTLEEFNQFILETGYETEAEKDGWGWILDKKWAKAKKVNWKTPFGNDADIIYNNNSKITPVLQVSWNDSIAYTHWLANKKNYKVRLPSEYEWEIFSKILHQKPEDLYKNKEYNSKEYINLIIDKIKNQNRIHKTGLIWEWTLNWFIKYSNGIENKEFGSIYKVLKGGSLISDSIQKISEYRFRRCPTARSSFYGFRIAFK